MKYNIFNIFLVFLGGLLATSCSEELNQVNPNKVTKDSFWKTPEQCEQGIVSIYNAFKNRNVMGTQIELQRSDMAHKEQNDNSNSFYLKSYNNSHPDIQNKWAAIYTGVFRANQAIEGLAKYQAENPDYDEDQWNNWYAQAVFFRGLFHYYAYLSFNKGNVIIRDRVPATQEEYSKPISSSEEVFAFFMNDLKTAYQEGMLSTDWSAANQDGRITRGAVAAVIGQAYLYEAQYDSARVYLKDVIDNYGYALVDDAAKNVSVKTELNTESILEIVYSYGLKPEELVNSELGLSAKYGDLVSPLETQWGQPAVLPSYWLQMAYKKDSMDVSDPRNEAQAIDIPTGEPLQKADGSDSIVVRTHNRRASAYIAFVDDEHTPYYKTRPALAWAFNVKPAAAFKMLSNCNDFKYDELPNETTYKSGMNYRVITLADVYLMYAEALIEGGTNEAGVAEALDYINKIRYRSALLLCGMPSPAFPGSDFDDKAYTAQDVMDQLMYVERPLEISIQGFATRHIDLRRWGIYKQRFQELAEAEYCVGSYPYITLEEVDVEGEMKMKFTYPNATTQIINPDTDKKFTRWGCVLYDASYLKDAVGWDLKPTPSGLFVKEFGESAANYIEDSHAYWPIPLVEEATNPALYSGGVQ